MLVSKSLGLVVLGTFSLARFPLQKPPLPTSWISALTPWRYSKTTLVRRKGPSSSKTSTDRRDVLFGFGTHSFQKTLSVLLQGLHLSHRLSPAAKQIVSSASNDPSMWPKRDKCAKWRQCRRRNLGLTLGQLKMSLLQLHPIPSQQVRSIVSHIMELFESRKTSVKEKPVLSFNDSVPNTLPVGRETHQSHPPRLRSYDPSSKHVPVRQDFQWNTGNPLRCTMCIKACRLPRSLCLIVLTYSYLMNMCYTFGISSGSMPLRCN